jgi:hypothetical protein
MLGNGVQDIEGIDSYISFGVGKAYQSIVQENIKPLLIEFLFLSNKISLACVYDLIVVNVVFEVLHYLDSQVQIVLSVTVYKFANVLSLIGALLDDVTVVLE